MEKNIYSEIEEIIINANLNEEERSKLMASLIKLKNEKLNILITGATGCGKSSTINAMFGEEVAKVGVGVDPETMEIEKYSLGNMILWDSPGLGDGKEADNKHARNIIRKLAETDENGNALIDVVLVILDGSSRDLGTSYELINNIIIPNLGPNRENRILVAINQADMAMKGRNWNKENNRPNAELTTFLDAKAESVKRRIYEGTGVEVEPIYYSAGYTDGEERQNPYNLTKLYSYILRMTPKKKDWLTVTTSTRMKTYGRITTSSGTIQRRSKTATWKLYQIFAQAGGSIGERIGSNFGTAGRIAGRVVGTVVGGVVGAIVGLFR